MPPPPCCATAAVSAAPVAPRFPGHAKPVVVRTDDAPQGAATRFAEGLRIGLSDSGTKLVLPWFVTELTDAVNQGKSAGDTAKALAQGF